MRASAIRDITFRARTEGAAEAAAEADKLGKAVDGAAKSNDNLSRSTLSVDRALDRVRRQIDESYRQSRQYESGLRTLDKALEMGRIGVDDYQRDLGLLASRFGVVASGSAAVAGAVEASAHSIDAAARANDNFRRSSDGAARAAGLNRHELINLGRQAQDVGTMFAMGATPMQVFASQSAQIIDIFSSSQGTVRGFFGQVATGVASFVTSAAGIATGIAAVGVAGAVAAYQYASGQREIETALIGTGRASGMTVGSINRVAESVADLGVLSRSTARDLASVFAATGRIDASLVPGLISASRGYGQLTGQGDRAAAEALAQAFASPSAGAAELEKRLGTLDDALMQYIRNAEASGNRTGAQKALFDALSPAIAEAANKTGLLARAWNTVANAASGAWDRIGQALSGQASAEERLGEAIKRRQGMSDPGTSAGWANSAVRKAVAAADAEVSELQEQVRRQNALQSERTRDAQASQLSREAGDVLRDLFGDEKRLQDLRNQKELLEKTFGDASAMAKLGPLAPRVSEGLDRLNSSLANFETAAQRAANDNALQIQSINAYTMAEKVAVEMERARVEAIRAGRSELQAGVEAEQARSRVIAEANRQLRDTSRDLRDAGSLIGLSPYQRSLRENENANRRERETLGASAGSSGTLTRDQALDLIMKHESAGRNIHQNIVGPNGGYNPSTGTVTGPSSAQGYFQITNPTWRDGARLAGVDTRQYPNAMAAPYDVQRQVAGALYDQSGFSRWAPYNAGLRAAIGGQSVGAANDNATARNANTVREAYEGWNTPLATAERQLAANIALQKRQAETMFMSSAEITKAAEKQRLLNEYSAQGVPITESLSAKIDDYAKRAAEAADSSQAFAAAQEAWRTVGDAGKDFAGGFLRDLRAGKTAAEAFANSLERLSDKILDLALSDIGKMFNGSGSTGFFSSMFKMFGFGGGSSTPTVSSGTGGLYANGGAFAYGNVVPFALGGAFTNRIVDRPTLFPFANGTGLMGEAGPEAIMPLRRGRDGRLGVSAAQNLPKPAPASAGGAVTFNLINNGQPVEVESASEVPDGRGGRRFDVVMKQQVAEAISQPGAASDAMKSTFGAKRRLASR